MKNRKGFALSGIIYSLLILFLVLVLNSLNNLQNKKQILDQLKLDTVNAIDQPWQVELANLKTTITEQLNELKSKVDRNTSDINSLQNKFIGGMGTSVANSYVTNSFAGYYIKNGICYVNIRFKYTGSYIGWESRSIIIEKLPPMKPGYSFEIFTTSDSSANAYIEVRERANDVVVKAWGGTTNAEASFQFHYPIK